MPAGRAVSESRYVTFRLTRVQAEAVIAAVQERLAGGEGEWEATWDDPKRGPAAAERGVEKMREALSAESPRAQAKMDRLSAAAEKAIQECCHGCGKPLGPDPPYEDLCEACCDSERVDD